MPLSPDLATKLELLSKNIAELIILVEILAAKSGNTDKLIASILKRIP